VAQPPPASQSGHSVCDGGSHQRKTDLTDARRSAFGGFKDFDVHLRSFRHAHHAIVVKVRLQHFPIDDADLFEECMARPGGIPQDLLPGSC
jgi:hypothetical protein